ncbi:hypothetical protein EGW08_013003, partial [Elysia chlorotica]
LLHNNHQILLLLDLLPISRLSSVSFHWRSRVRSRLSQNQTFSTPISLTSKMFTKAAPLLRVVPRMQQATRLGHGVPAHWKPMRQICEENKNHMNCMPVPQGSWKEHHAAQNAKWNKHLAIAAVLCVATYSW